MDKTPLDNSNNVEISDLVTLTFSKHVRNDNLAGYFYVQDDTNNKIEGLISLSNGNKQLSFDTNPDFSDTMIYRVTLSKNIADIDGEILDVDVNRSFKAVSVVVP